MRITLVNPTQGFFRGMMPLGLISIATYLRDRGGFQDVTLLDSNCQDIYGEYTPADIVGITAVSNDIQNAVNFAKFVKAKSDIPVVLGGVHISTFRKLPEPFDVGVIGEGEQTMLELAQAKDLTVETLRTIKGICFRENGQMVFTEPRPLSRLDDLPIPDRKLSNLSYYLKPRLAIPYHKGRTLTLMSSRGCPFHCVFCSTRVHWQKFRAHSAERVVDEIETLVEYGAEIIHIFDDLFIADRKRFIAIQEQVVARGINRRVKFMCLVRSDLLDDQIMGLLKEMNVVVMGIGMESGAEVMLQYLKRGTSTVADNRRAIALAEKYEIPAMGSFMLGNPGETEKDLEHTLEFIRGYRHSPYLAPLVYLSAAFPGTEFWQYAKDKGVPVEDFDRVAMDIPDRPEKMLSVPLLADIPHDRFFEIAQRFVKEVKYGAIKRHIFFPKAWWSHLYALGSIIWIEKNPGAGIREFIKFYEKRTSSNCADGIPSGMRLNAEHSG